MKASASYEQKYVTSSTAVYGLASVVVKDMGGEYNLSPSQLPALSTAAARTLRVSGPLAFRSTYGAYFVLSTRKLAQLTTVIDISSTSSDSSQQIQAGLDGNLGGFSADVQTTLNNVRARSDLTVNFRVEGTTSCAGIDPVANPERVASSCYQTIMSTVPLTTGLETVLMRFSDLPSYASALAQYKGTAVAPVVPGLTAFAKQTPAVQDLASSIWEASWFLQQTAVPSLNRLGLARGATLLAEIQQLQAAVTGVVTDPPLANAQAKLYNLNLVAASLERNVLWVDRSTYPSPSLAKEVTCGSAGAVS
jgi:hypothetical protein